MRPLGPALVAALLSVGAVCCGGCHGAEDGRGGTAPGPGAAAPHEKVVATVDGVAITASRVAATAEETGLGPREVLDRLIDFELLAAEARRRGFDRDPDARATARKAMVQRYLDAEFVGARPPEQIRDRVLRDAYERNIKQFVRPRLVYVAHILVRFPSKAPSSAEERQAEHEATEIAAKARRVRSYEEFLELGKSLAASADRRIRVETLKSPIHEEAAYDEGFVRGALALQKVGETSAPVRSSFGYHVIYVRDVKAPLNVGFEAARDEVRAKEYPFWLSKEFLEETDRMRFSSKVTGFTGEPRRDD